LTNVALPSNSTYVAQILWGAIGWSVGACLGASLAAKETGEERRTVLFVGDGSLQLVSGFWRVNTGPSAYRSIVKLLVRVMSYETHSFVPGLQIEPRHEL